MANLRMKKYEKQIADVIDMTNQLESEMADLLSQCLIPVISDYGFLREAVFHNTCVHFGAKVKLLKRITEYWSFKGLNFKWFYILLDLRNAFAHTPTTKRMVQIWFDDKDSAGRLLGSEMIVDKKSGSSWQNQIRNEAFKDFVEAYNSCRGILVIIDNKIKQTIAQHSPPDGRGAAPRR